MDFFSAMKVSAGALSAQRTRMNVISSNIANAGATSSTDGSGTYKKKSVVFQAQPIEQNAFKKAAGQAVETVKVKDIIEDQSDPRRIFDPKHPDADEEGYIALPNVNVVEEMVNLINSSRSYQASATAFKNIKEMANMALSISN